MKQLVFDKASLGSSRRWIDDQGRLHVDGCRITKEEVADYLGSEIPDWEALGLDPGKVYSVYRPRSEIEKAQDALEQTIPISNGHISMTPDRPNKERRIGTVTGNTAWDGPYLTADVVFEDQRWIDTINDGSIKDFSVGYGSQVKRENGEFEGKPYSLKFTNISPNHLALVPSGRVKGAEVHDSADKIQSLRETMTNKQVTMRDLFKIRRISQSLPSIVFDEALDIFRKSAAPDKEGRFKQTIHDCIQLDRSKNKSAYVQDEDGTKKEEDVTKSVMDDDDDVPDEPVPDDVTDAEGDSADKDKDKPSEVADTDLTGGVNQVTDEPQPETAPVSPPPDGEKTIVEIKKTIPVESMTMDHNSLQKLINDAAEEKLEAYRQDIKRMNRLHSLASNRYGALTFDSANEMVDYLLKRNGIDKVQGMTFDAKEQMLEAVMTRHDLSKTAQPKMVNDSDLSKLIVGNTQIRRN